ncbi:MAG: hypothetical protein II620_02670, partial [Paludibacteraceae bacterium]|nr:hypothetical protein [Paludibacteraceae bacterium]
LRFMHKELAEMVADTLRPNDLFVIGDVYYAGGTVNKDISPEIVSSAIEKSGKNAIFAGSKDNCLKVIAEQTPDTDCVILVMGARDPKLSDYAASIAEQLR